jgi:hypothetical protein
MQSQACLKTNDASNQVYLFAYLVKILACCLKNVSAGALEEIARALITLIRSVESLLFNGIFAHINTLESFHNLPKLFILSPSKQKSSHLQQCTFRI